MGYFEKEHEMLNKIVAEKERKNTFTKGEIAKKEQELAELETERKRAIELEDYKSFNLTDAKIRICKEKLKEMKENIGTAVPGEEVENFRKAINAIYEPQMEKTAENIRKSCCEIMMNIEKLNAISGEYLSLRYGIEAVANNGKPYDRGFHHEETAINDMKRYSERVINANSDIPGYGSIVEFCNLFKY